MIKRIGQWSNLFSIWEVFMQAHCYGYILGKNPGIFPMLRGGITIFWDRWENTFYSKKTEKSVIYCIPTLRLTMLQQLHWMDWRPPYIHSKCWYYKYTEKECARQAKIFRILTQRDTFWWLMRKLSSCFWAHVYIEVGF